MTFSSDELFGGKCRLSPFVRRLGYSGSPLPMDEWLKLREITASFQRETGQKRVNLPPAVVSCVHCGKIVVKKAFEIEKHEKRGLVHFYCSNDCWGAGENERRFGQRLCARCGGPAPKRNGSFGARQRGRIFCSKKCLDDERAEELEQRLIGRMKPCKRCHAMFVPPNSASDFCSRSCASRAHAAKMAGEGNPRWKNGAFASRVKPHVTRRFRELRPLVMRRDGMRCVLCDAARSNGKRVSLEVHHIDEDALNNRASNLVTLCRECHERVHFSPERETLCEKLKKHAATPMSMTYRWKRQNASSLTES